MLNIHIDTFEVTLAELLKDEGIAFQIVAAQQGKFKAQTPKKPTLDKKKFEEVMNFHLNQNFSNHKALEDAVGQLNDECDRELMMLKQLMYKTKTADDLFETYGMENEIYQENLAGFMYHDEDFRKEISKAKK